MADPSGDGVCRHRAAQNDGRAAGSRRRRHSAQRWLADPSNADASGLERASALFMTGDAAAASAALDRYVPRDATEAAGLTRMRSVFRARETGVVDMDAIRAATEGLADGERRYQLTSAAFSQAWLDIEAGRPWRSAFAQAARTLGPHPVPLRRRLWIARSGAGGTDRRRRGDRHHGRPRRRIAPEIVGASSGQVRHSRHDAR